jgi:hypothetical protein
LGEAVEAERSGDKRRSQLVRGHSLHTLGERTLRDVVLWGGSMFLAPSFGFCSLRTVRYALAPGITNAGVPMTDRLCLL